MIFLDVDGVVAPYTAPALGVDLGRLGARVAGHTAAWLRELAAAGQLTWASTWEEETAVICHALSLGDVPWLALPAQSLPWRKLVAVRRVARPGDWWVDDALPRHPSALAWARSAGVRTLAPDRDAGLQPTDLAVIGVPAAIVEPRR